VGEERKKRWDASSRRRRLRGGDEGDIESVAGQIRQSHQRKK
jgi:hypothetical protein